MTAAVDGSDDHLEDMHHVEITTLVNKLTSTIMDVTCVEDFLLTYRFFMSPSELMMAVKGRLRLGFFSTEADAECIKLRSYVFLRIWIKGFWEVDFVGPDGLAMINYLVDEIKGIRKESKSMGLLDHQVLLKLENLLQSSQEESGNESSSDLVSNFSAKDSLALKLPQIADRPKRPLNFGTVFQKMFSLTPLEQVPEGPEPRYETDDIEPIILPLSKLGIRGLDEFILARENSTIICRQLAIFFRKHFRSLEWQEFLIYSAKTPDMTPSISKYIDIFNKFTEWLSSEIASIPSTRRKLFTLRKLIKTARKSLQVGDFCSLLGLVLAMQSTSLHDDLALWKEVSQGDKKVLDDLIEFCSPLRGFQNIRRAMDTYALSLEPCVPFIAIYLADLAVLREQPDGPEGLMPWLKCRRSASTLRQLRSFLCSQRDYDFSVDEYWQSYFTAQMVTSLNLLNN